MHNGVMLHTFHRIDRISEDRSFNERTDRVSKDRTDRVSEDRSFNERIDRISEDRSSRERIDQLSERIDSISEDRSITIKKCASWNDLDTPCQLLHEPENC